MNYIYLTLPLLYRERVGVRQGESSFPKIIKRLSMLPLHENKCWVKIGLNKPVINNQLKHQIS